MSEKPKISIIIPVYNVEQYVAKCLDSVVLQDINEIEIIIVDDGSTDRSGLICDQYAHMDHRIQVIHQENQGLSMARNRGIDLARGEYIGFVDSDDWIAPDMYSTLYKNAMLENSDLSMTNFYYTPPVGECVPFSSEGTGIRVFDGIYKIAHNIRTANNFAWNKLYRHRLFDGIRFPQGKTFEDIFTIYQLVDKANRMVVSAQCKYYYYRRDDSITLSQFRMSHLDNIEAYIVRHDYISEKYPRLESTCRKQIFTSVLWVISKLYRGIDKNVHSEAVRRIREMIESYDYRTCGLTGEAQNFLGQWFQKTNE